MGRELFEMTVREIAGAVASRSVSPVEVVEGILARIHRINPVLNAYCVVAEDEARAAARLSERAVMAGESLGPLHGVPVSIKDLIFTEGLRTTFGSAMHAGFVPEHDEVVVERLKAAGAIVLGKTNTCEFGYKAVTDNRVFGATRNPWDATRTPGGSSGGAGAAVASGLGPLAIGSDGGGSIRCPASFCGVFGFKPSRGRIPIHPLLTGWETLDRRIAQLGPLTRTVGDAALAMEVMAGPDDRDPLTLPDRVGYQRAVETRSLRGVRAAATVELNGAVLDGAVRDTVEKAFRVFEDLGCSVEQAQPEIGCMHEAFQRLFAADAAGAVGDRIEEWRERLDRGFARVVDMGLSVSAAEYVRTQDRVHVLWDRLQRFFGDYDILLTPTLPVPPFALGVDWPREVAGAKVHPLNFLAYTYPFNLTGLPAASVPCGWTGGLPVGLQVVGKRFADLTVLRAAAAFEEARPWATSWPALNVNEAQAPRVVP